MPEQDSVQTLKSFGITINTRGTSRGTDTIKMRSSLSLAISNHMPFFRLRNVEFCWSLKKATSAYLFQIAHEIM